MTCDVVCRVTGFWCVHACWQVHTSAQRPSIYHFCCRWRVRKCIMKPFVFVLFSALYVLGWNGISPFHNHSPRTHARNMYCVADSKQRSLKMVMSWTEKVSYARKLNPVAVNLQQPSLPLKVQRMLLHVLFAIFHNRHLLSGRRIFIHDTKPTHSKADLDAYFSKFGKVIQ